MVAKLIVMGEQGPSREHRLGRLTTLGRHTEQSIQILDRLCSKEHAVVEERDGDYFVRDLGSRNGTFHNGQQVSGEAKLANGDTLLLGNTRLVFVDQAQEPATAPSATRVTIAPELLRSAIEHKLTPSGDAEFLPEASIPNMAELRADYERLRMAYQLQNDIALEVDLDTLLNKIMDSLFNSLRCDRGAILLVDRQSGELETRCVRTRGRGDAGDITISRTIIDQVVQGRSAVLSSDASVDSRFDEAQSIILSGIRSTMSVPLLAKGREQVLGIIHLDSLVATSVFTKRDLNLVQSLANQAALAIENSFLVAQREEDTRLREKFSRLLSPNLVEQLVTGRVEITKGGQSRLSTVLFSDLRGFTSMSERLEPQEIVTMLNEYFEIMVDVVFEFDGTLDKYMGDGIMAVWGSPVDIPDAPIKAVQAALKMRAVLEEFNQLRRAEGLEEMRMGVGIDTGELVAGYMGSTKTMNYTVIGPPVNLAARLCGVAGHNEVLISDNTLELVRDRVNVATLDALQLKGISAAISPHNVLSLR